ncbi:DASH complex subunit ask1 [Coemansia nantahalensis]|uniref:DASH complex subunit ask1 n=1 Tax=Coemansia nantahalensis TaxID=2789366 RepID=A0ACC1JVW2_9FUNG|nr:DASH complex subunit ask1 [Coemansia nantahalensis]
MAHFGPPDGRAGQTAGLGGGRFASTLSAALRMDDFARPPVPPAAPRGPSAEEELEEIEQKITLTLQAIDANFDHSQRTMARDVMPKVEQLGRLSGELLQASQPWLQFFMAVAAVGENDEADAEGLAQAGRLLDDDNTRGVELGLVQRAAIEEQAHMGDITARFPDTVRDDDEESIDIDAEVATPQLTSRFMTEELRAARMPDTAPTTPRVVNLKRMAEHLSVSAKKRRLGTPRASAAPKTPVSMMRALVSSRSNSVVSKTSTIDTADLMPTTSPPHTTTFVLPQSRRIAPPRAAAAAADRLDFGEDDDDDEILDEINSLIKRYDSPRSRPAGSAAQARTSTGRGGPRTAAGSRAAGSAARSEARSVSTGQSDERHMAALADKYAAPVLAIESGPGEAQRALGLVADMEEMLEEVEAMATGDAEDSPDAATEPPVEATDDVDDELPSPPRITSDLERSRVVVPEISASAAREPSGAGASGAQQQQQQQQRAAQGGRPAHQPRRTFGRPNPITMSAEDMDAENMTIGHMSPLANRGRPARSQQAPEPMVPATQRFYPLANDPDDPFGPTPARHSMADTGPRSRAAPLSVQSDRPAAAGAGSARPWSTRMDRDAGGSVARSASGALGSDATATFDSPGLAVEHPTGDSRLNDSSLTIDHHDYSQLSIDGTTTILPTRDMLQRAARASEGVAEADAEAARSPTPPSPAESLVHEFAADMFPPMFQSPPASLQLRELWELVRAAPQRIWTLDELVAAGSAGGELAGASPSVFLALLDLLARRRLVRKVADGLWTAH